MRDKTFCPPLPPLPMGFSNCRVIGKGIKIEEPKPEEKPLRLSNNEIRNLKKRGFIILPASFLYPQLVGTPGFNPTARVKVMKEHFKNL